MKLRSSYDLTCWVGLDGELFMILSRVELDGSPTGSVIPLEGPIVFVFLVGFYEFFTYFYDF